MLDEFINVYMRNHHIYFYCAHQSISQLDAQLRNTLLSLGNYVFGRVALRSEARELADVLWKRDPFRVKHYRNVWGKYDSLGTFHASSSPAHNPYFVLDREPEFLGLDDQLELNSQKLTDLGLWEFLFRPAEGEGEVGRSVYSISIANLVRDSETGTMQFPDPAVLALLRTQLAAHSGMPVKALPAEQERRALTGHQPPHPDRPPAAEAIPAPTRYRQRLS
jgi:hypothetical protein